MQPESQIIGREQQIQSLENVGFRPLLTKIASNVIRTQLPEALRPIGTESEVVVRLAASEYVYNMFSREPRLVATEAILKDPSQYSFNTERLAATAKLALENINAPHQPLNVLIDEQAKTFDVRVPAKQILVALETENNEFQALGEGDVSEAQAVILNSKLSGLTPKEILQRFPQAYLFISNSDKGLQMEADHLVMDGAVMQTIMTYLLADSSLENIQLPMTQSDRDKNIIDLNINQNDSIKSIMMGIGKSSRDIGGEDSKTWVTALRSTEDWDASTKGRNKLSRIIPVPVNSSDLANEDAFRKARDTFANIEQNINDTDVAYIVLQAVKNLRLSRDFCRNLVKTSSIFPFGLIGELPNALTAIWPHICFDELDIPESSINSTIGDYVKSVTAAINLFPKEWGPVVFARPSITLPSSQGDVKIKGLSLSGSSTNKMQAFADAYSDRERN